MTGTAATRGTMSELARGSIQTEPEVAGDPWQPGTWVWVGDDDDGRWFGCILERGSNYVYVESPHTRGSQSWYTQRVHADDLDCLEIVSDPDAVIEGRVAHYQAEVRRLMNEAKLLCESLGLSGRMLPENTMAIVPASKTGPKRYRNALVKAQEKTLPAIFKAVDGAHAELARWMSARLLPMQGDLSRAKTSMDSIKDRVFAIELYAGLVETVKQVRRGKPAGMADKLHIMQRRHYMDEECLVDYQHGGMEFADIKAFDRWVSTDPQLSRIFPFPRCLVAFQVRRHTKCREWDGTLAGAFIRIGLERADKLTFLYIRNGNRLYRLNTEVEFGGTLFPDRDEWSPGTPMRAKMFAGEVRHLITEADYQERVAAEKARERKERAWAKRHPGKSWIDNPHRSWMNELRDFEPYSPESVYYDDIRRHVDAEVTAYNRIAVIVQGLFDRSTVLHPHPPVRLFAENGMDAVVLVRDSDHALYPSAAPPDFAVYRARLNASLAKGSYAVGQEDYWLRVEAQRECARRDRDWRDESDYRPTRFRPHGNPGPGKVAQVANWRPRKRTATFRWERESQRYRGDPVPCRLVVPEQELLHVNAYAPGDFRQFYLDPRTRADYLQWADLLLTAEEWCANGQGG